MSPTGRVEARSEPAQQLPHRVRGPCPWLLRQSHPVPQHLRVSNPKTESSVSTKREPADTVLNAQGMVKQRGLSKGGKRWYKQPKRLMAKLLKELGPFPLPVTLKPLPAAERKHIFHAGVWKSRPCPARRLSAPSFPLWQRFHTPWRSK